MARAPLRAPVALLLAAAVAVAVGDAAAQAPPTSCTLQLDGAPQTFDRCMTIQGIGDAFQLFWTVGSGGGVTWGMSTASSSGYVALGAPPSSVHSVAAAGPAL